MTRLAVLSDIHGNLPALQAVLEDAGRQSIDRYLQAGDYTGGPQAAECLRLAALPARLDDPWQRRAQPAPL